MNPTHLNFRSQAWRWLAVIGLGLITVIGGRSSQAGFETSSTSTTNFINTEFRSVWGYYRASRVVFGSLTPDNTNVLDTNHYDVWAVGKSVSPNGINQYDGVIYYFNGSQWSSVSYANSPVQPKALNAVTGQYNPGGGYAEIWFGGLDDQTADPGFSDSCTTIYYLSNNYLTSGGATTQYNLSRVKIIDADGVSTCRTPGNDGPTGRLHATLKNEIYAMAADQHYKTVALAGGQGGLLLAHAAYIGQLGYQCVNDTTGATGVDCDPSHLTPPDCSAGNSCQPKPDSWQRVASTTIPTTEHITGISVARNRTAFIVTSTSNTGVLDRTCVGNQHGHLYKDVKGTVSQISIPSFAGCFFGVTVAPLDSYPPDHSQNYNVLWIATSNGVYRYDESSGTMTGPLAGTSGRAFYSLTGFEDRGGSGKNLLLNGDFESWESQTPTNPAGDPGAIATSTWLGTDEGNIGRNNKLGNCASNTNDIMPSDDHDQGSYGLKIEPGIYYSSLGECNATTNQKKDAVAVMYQEVPLTLQEGRTYRVTGRYKVEFPDPTGPIAQGGISLSCPSGGFGDPQDEPDCTFENRSGIRTKTQGATGGWVSFSTTLTKNDLQFTSPIIGGTKAPRPSDKGMMMQIQCEGTYGARVWCDSLKVELVDDPALAAHDTWTIMASSSGGTVMTSPNGTAVTTAAGDLNAFVSEPNQLASTDPLYAVSAVDSQHIYAVGNNSLLLQHAPGNVSGGIWSGTGSLTATGQATLGWIAANCASLRDSADVSLCQRSAQSFGLNLENNVLSGRAWFGKQYTSSQSSDDSETLNLGRCNSPAAALDPARLEAYSYAGACDRSTRTCVTDPNHACNRDFDCFGRCERDQGFICTDDADCQIGGVDTDPANDNSQALDGRLTTQPANRLTCGTNSNPQSCTALGWLSFDQNDTDTPPAGANNCSPSTTNACYSSAGNVINGWGRLLTLSGSTNGGWIHLRGANVSPAAPFIGCQNCSGSLTCGFCQDSKLHSCLSGTSCHYYCQGTSTQCANDNQCASGVSCGPQGRCAQSPSTICSTDTDCDTNGRCLIGATCDVVGSCSQYGVNFDPVRQQFSGYAWSGNLGWLDFSSLRVGISPFLQTRLADIFAKGRVGSANNALPPGGLCNATYVIIAGGSITNFCSSQQGGTSLRTSAPNIPLLGPTNVYTNALGRLDLTGLSRVVKGSLKECDLNVTSDVNKYGTPVCTLTPVAGGNLSTSFPSTRLDQSSNQQLVDLSNRVYLVSGSGLKIDQEMAFVDGSQAGALVVTGNLTINRNLSYGVSSGGGSITDLNQLASLVVIVQGDLTIDSAVTNLVGTYIVFGTIHTTSGGADNRYPLTVRGMLIAKTFDFARTFAGTTDNPAPAELVIFDGRFQSNPLPGMTDFSSVLPNTLGANP